MNYFPKVSVLLIGLVTVISCNTDKKTKEEAPIEKDKVVTEADNPLLNINLEKSLKAQGLVNIANIDTSILVNLKYSSKDNFFQKDVYGKLEKAFMQLEPAAALAKANTYLKNENPNLRLIVYDAARPLSIQQILWESLDSIPPKLRKNYVADPAEGSIHNYGCAVDLSIFNKSSNQDLDMGTKYDFFGYEAYPRKEKEMLERGILNIDQIKNRELLRKVMTQAGYMPISSEWWHFNYYSRAKAKRLYKIIN